jgi:hypothetical protein
MFSSLPKPLEVLSLVEFPITRLAGTALAKGRDTVTASSKSKVPDIPSCRPEVPVTIRPRSIGDVRSRLAAVILGVNIDAVLDEEDNSRRILLYPARSAKYLHTDAPVRIQT